MRCLTRVLALIATLVVVPLMATPDEQGTMSVTGAVESGIPPDNKPPPPPAVLPTPPTEPQQSPPRQAPADTGQWVHTAQYGWVWMPYGDDYTYAPEDGSTPSMYVYYPDFGWCWLTAPWLWGWGPMPYFGLLGPGYYGWYGRGLGRWGGFAGHYGRFGAGFGGFRGGGGYRGGGGSRVGGFRGGAAFRVGGAGFHGGSPGFHGGGGGFHGGGGHR